MILQSLESAAQAQNCRALFMIDALNEGEGQKNWPNYYPVYWMFFQDILG